MNYSLGNIATILALQLCCFAGPLGKMLFFFLGGALARALRVQSCDFAVANRRPM